MSNPIIGDGSNNPIEYYNPTKDPNFIMELGQTWEQASFNLGMLSGAAGMGVAVIGLAACFMNRNDLPMASTMFVLGITTSITGIARGADRFLELRKLSLDMENKGLPLDYAVPELRDTTHASRMLGLRRNIWNGGCKGFALKSILGVMFYSLMW